MHEVGVTAPGISGGLGETVPLQRSGVATGRGESAVDSESIIAALSLQVEQLTEENATLNARIAGLERQANHDELTGLYNQGAWERDVRERIERGDSVAVLRLDLNNFKALNDTLGHETGNEILKAFANRLRHYCSRASDAIAARFGGDEFDICVDIGPPPSSDEHQPERRTGDDPYERAYNAYEHVSLIGRNFVADVAQILSRTDPKLGEQFMAIRLGFATGIGASTPDYRVDYDTLMRQVDEAMYEEKADGRVHEEPPSVLLGALGKVTLAKALEEAAALRAARGVELL